MRERVRQRLFDDPVRGEVDSRRKRFRPTLDLEFDWKAGPLHLPQQGPQVAHAGLRRERRFALLGTQDSQQAAHLVQRLPAGLFDRERSLPRPRRLLWKEEAGGLGLDRHDRHTMRDHVMEIAGDAGALRDDGGARPLLALAPESGGPVLERVGAARSALEREGGQPKSSEEEKETEDAEIGVVADDGHVSSGTPDDDRGARKADRHGGDRLLAAVVRACEPERERQRDEREEPSGRAIGERRRIDQGHAGGRGEDKNRSPEREAAPNE